MNVLFIAVDDLRPDFGAYGNRMVHSPNLDGLARTGVTFTRAYCQQAVCSPSRTSLLTGCRPDTTKVYELQTHFRKHLPDIVTLPEHFRNNGYATTGLSKIYHGGLDDAASWSIPHWAPGGPRWNSAENADRNARLQERLRAAGLRMEAAPRSAQERGPAWVAAPGGDLAQPDGKTAEMAVSALEELRESPFFLAVGFLKPHLPFTAPSEYFDLYKGKEIALPANFNRPGRGVPPLALHNSGELRTYLNVPKEGPISEKEAKELTLAYYASLSFMDAQLGKLMAALERMKLVESTAIILWGDHGYHLGDHGLWNKHTNFEKATRVPLIIRVPGMKTAGRQTTALTEFVDIYPSLAEICGLSLPDSLEGTSFVPLLRNPARPWKRAAFSQYPRANGVMGYSMRTSTHRYTEWKQRDGAVAARELYDHRADPAEDNNLATVSGSANLVAELSRWMAEGWRGARPRPI